MSNAAATHGSTDPPADAETTLDPALLAAVRALLDLASAAGPTGPDGVLLDVVAGGVRCRVTRAPEPTAHGGRTGAGGVNGAHRPMLSPREQEIVRMVGAGFTNKEIASVLEISSFTVSTHVRRIFGKLDVSSRAAMVARASPFLDR